MRKGRRLSLFSLKHLYEGIKNGDISPADSVDACFDKIRMLNLSLGAFISVVEEDVIYKQALEAEKEIRQGKLRGPLHGIPFFDKRYLPVKRF